MADATPPAPRDPALPATSAPSLPGTPASLQPWTASSHRELRVQMDHGTELSIDRPLPTRGVTYSQTGKRVILYERTGMSLKIRPLPLDNVRWHNDRGLHAETELEFQMGTMLPFGKRVEKTWPHKNKAWVAYELPGVKKTKHGREDAHVTVYDGPIGPHSFY